MGRIRTIKPEVLTDAKAALLSDAAWRLWISTWLLADDAGRLPAEPIILAGQIFPSRALDECSRALEELARVGLLRLYQVNGDRYAEIPAWSKHQKIDRPSGPKFPAPCGEFDEPSTSPRRAPDADHDHDRDHDRDQSVEAGPGLAPDSPSKPDLAKRLAAVVIAELNRLTGRAFSATAGPTLSDCRKLVKLGHTSAEACAVIAAKHRDWRDDDRMSKHLKPSVLLRPSNFAKYLAEDVDTARSRPGDFGDSPAQPASVPTQRMGDF